MSMKSTDRFGALVDNYVRYRPHYPERVLVELVERTGLRPDSVVADIGSGTGILSEPFLKNGNTVIGVEPNEPMRRAAESLLTGYPNFKSVEGTAEATTLPDDSVHMIVAGQAFHWFDRQKAKTEFKRILRKDAGYCALLWNERLTDTNPFLQEYEKLLQEFGTDYSTVDHRKITRAAIEEFFAPDILSVTELAHEQRVDYSGLKGRLLSSSYIPKVGEEGYEAMLIKLGQLFEKHEREGEVAILYECRVYLGNLVKRS